MILQFLSCKNTNDNTYNISGTVEGLETGAISILEYTGDGDEFVLNKSTIEDGKFSFFGNVLRSKSVIGNINDTYDFTLFLEPGDINITINELPEAEDDLLLIEPTITGGVDNELYNTFRKTRDSISELQTFKDIDVLYAKYAKAIKAENAEEIIRLENKMYVIEASNFSIIKNARKQFILKNPKSIVAPHVLLLEGEGITTEVFTEEELNTMVSNFDTSIHYNDNYKECVYSLDAIKNLATGKIAPNFTLNTFSGKSVSLKDYRGKVVLLNFWAHWCAPCVDEFPNFKTLYTTYHKKGLEIISISDDPDVSAWQEAIKEHNLPWTQCIVGADRATDVSRSYYIETLPTTYLIGKNGEILGKNMDSETLQNILKSKLN